MAFVDVVIKDTKNLITKIQMLKYKNFKNSALIKNFMSNICKLELR